MKITFLGAAQTVTGSCYVLESEGRRFAVDCGMHQGSNETEARNWNMEPYRPRELDFILITHAHIDHTGLLPRLVKEGFSGPIHATSATRDLMEIMLMDSAHIQEMEAEWRNKKSQRHGQRPSEPLYTQADVEKTLALIRPVEYNQELSPCAGVTAVFRDAGHILGSSVIELCYEEGGQRRKVVFSGDLGRPNQLLINDPTPVQTADFLFVESTYGDRDHKNEDKSRDELAEAIAYAYQNREKVIIPAFAVGRTQELLYTLHLLAAEGRLPADMPVFVDSPLAIKATEIFRRNPAYLDDEARVMLANGDNPLKFKNLKFTLKTDESQAINAVKGAAVVISASGMANAGRIKHHLRHNLWRKGAAVVFAGYQALGTPGRKIVDGAKKIRLLGEEVAVNARVFTIGGFSAHAGLSQLLAWMENFRGGRPEVILVHGEPAAQKNLAERIKAAFGWTVHIPGYLEELTLIPGQVPAAEVVKERAAPPRIDWDFLLGDSDRLLTELRARLPRVGALPRETQSEIRDRLMEINRMVVELVSEI